MLFLIVKYVHILSAIVAVGLNISYAVWILRAQRDSAHTGFALKGIKFLDDRVANPCYGGLLVTGLILVFIGHIGFTTTWVVIAIVMWVLLVIVAAALYTPTLKKQVEAVGAEGWQSPAYQAASKRGTIVGAVLAAMALLIVLDMVVKPHF